MNRREFLKSTALAAGAVLGARAQQQQQPARVCLHAFSKPLGWLDYDALAETLARAGYGGIDLTVRPKGHVEPERVGEDLPRAVAAARKQGLKIDMIVTALASEEDPGAERLLKTAVQCGVKYYRMGYLNYDPSLGVEDSIAACHKRLEGLEALNRACGIVGCYQNHFAWNDRLFGGAVWDIHAALKGLDPKWIGCQYDVRHAMAESGGSWSIAMRLIAPYIRTVCLKDFVWMETKGRWRPESVFGGDGIVPWERYFKLLKALKLTAPATVHCEWELFSAQEKALPEPERRAIALRKMKHDGDFFAAQYTRYGVATEP